MNQAASSIMYLIDYALLIFQYWFYCMILSACGTNRQLCNKGSNQMLTNKATLAQNSFHLNQSTRKQKAMPYSTCEAEVVTATNTAQNMQFIHDVLNSGG